MTEIEGLKVIISAEVKAAIENMQKVQEGMSKLGSTTKKEVEKTTSFLTKFKLGWIALGAAAVGVLYSIIKQSPLLNAYMSEFGDILGYLGDTIGAIFAPFIEIALEGLWKLADWFESNAPMIRAAIMPILPIWQEFINIMVEAGKVILPAIVDVIAKIIKFLAELLTAIAKGDWDKAWKVISDAASGVWDWINIQFDKLLDWMSRRVSEHNWEGAWQYFKDALNTVWTEYILPALPNWLKDFLLWMDKFFNEADAREKIQMIAKKIVDAMDWAELGIAAADKFLSGLWKRIFPHVEYYRKLFGEKIPVPPGYPYNGEIPAAQTGIAFVPSTGIYQLHRGESVIPRGKSTSEGSNTINFNPTVNITGTTINSAMDVRQLAAQLTSYWRDDLQRYSRLGVT